jgi:hypothetical protein
MYEFKDTLERKYVLDDKLKDNSSNVNMTSAKNLQVGYINVFSL